MCVQLVTSLHPSVEFVTVIPPLSASYATDKCLSNVMLNVTLSSTPYSTTHFLVGKTSLLKRRAWPVSSLLEDELLPALCTSPRTPIPTAQAVSHAHGPSHSGAGHREYSPVAI